MSERKLPDVRINALLNSIRSVLSIVFPLITYPYATRILQAENLGKVNFASTTLSYFSLIAVLGLSSYAGREGIRYRDDRDKLNDFCSELLTVNICTTIFAYIALFTTIALVPKFHSYLDLFAIYSVTILFSTLGMEWVYTIFEDYKYITIRSILFQIVSLILLFVFVKKKSDYYIYAGINVLAGVGSNIFNFVHSRKYITPKIQFNKKIFEHLKHSVIFFASSIASSVYSNIDITMLGLMCSDYYVGIYSVSVKLYTMTRGVLGSIMAVTAPRLTYYKLNGKENEFNHMVTKLVNTMITLLLPVVVGINLTAKEIILVISGEGFIEAVPSLKILSFAIFASIFASITSIILLASRKEKKVLMATSIAAFVNLGFNLLVIPVWQQNGAAITTVLAETTIVIIGVINVRKLVSIGNLWKSIVTSLTGCSVMVVISLLCTFVFNNIIALLFAKVCLCAGVYFGVLLAMKNEIICEYWYMFKRKIKR